MAISYSFKKERDIQSPYIMPVLKDMTENPRDRVAAQIRTMRSKESEEYTLNRSGFNYLNALAGLQYAFSYIRGLSNPVVLDIGAGTTRGISELEQTALAHGLRFEATVLRNDASIRQHFGTERVHVTGVETLRGIPANSIGCVLGVLSVGYSAAPALAVRSIDRVLIHGGIVKLVLRMEKARSGAVKNLNPPSAFEGEFRALGYDVAAQDIGEAGILLAIKPGYEEAPKAEDLLNIDKDSLAQQASFFRNS